MRSFVSWPNVFVLLGSVLFLLPGCGPANTYQEAPAPKVKVTRPTVRTVTNYLEETGTTEAVGRVEIQARVEGVLESVSFEPGADLEAGAVLYQIEPDQYAARVAAAEADLLAQEARRKQAEIERDRQQRLRDRDSGATSEAAVVAAAAEFEGAAAAVKQAEAKLKQAQIDLDYTTVTTPIGGRVGKTEVKQGNLVGSGGQATVLTTVIQIDPIWANFNISERELLELLERRRGEGNQDEPDRAKIPIYLSRDTDEGFPFEGHFDYADFAVDQSMGTFLIRGVFANPDHRIIPGLFVRVRIPVGEQKDALLVPERALGFDQAGEFVLTVNDQNEVERRNVKTGNKFEGLVVVNQGLQADELVIIDGLQRSRPGATVDPQQVASEAGGQTEEVVPPSATEPPPPVDPEAESPEVPATGPVN